MSILTNIFTSSDADEAQAGTPSSSDTGADGAQEAPPPMDLPGDDGSNLDISVGGPAPFEDSKGPDTLMPGGEMDPQA